MYKLGKKLASFSVSKSSVHDSYDDPGAELAYISDTSALSPSVFYRYRKNRGVNLGSWFVLERWISDFPFRRAADPGKSDLDVASGDYAFGILNEHFREWIEQEDWDWLRKRGVNSVRIPIGYYHLCGLNKSLVSGTDFQSHVPLYLPAWAYIATAIRNANDRGISVLIDLHAAPGKQNNEDHGGTSTPGTFFSKPENLAHWTDVLHGLITALSRLNVQNIIGIEVLNEPAPPSDSALCKMYDKAIETLSEVDPTMPIYLGECWKLDPYTDYVVKKRKSIHPEAMLVLDHHLYRCFTAKDIKTTIAEHTKSLTDENASTPKKFAQVSEKLRRAGGDLVVGEWSAALNPGSLEGAGWEEQRRYSDAQLALFEKYCAGSYFWTYKKQVSGDKGWSFRDAVEGGTVPKWFGGLRLRRKIETGEVETQRRDANRTSERDSALASHTSYWKQHPGKYEPHRFGEGFAIGWDDAYLFFCFSPNSEDPSSPLPIGSSVSELGFLGAWARRRTLDHGKSYWEFEHGFNQGTLAARKDFEITYCTS